MKLEIQESIREGTALNNSPNQPSLCKWYCLHTTYTSTNITHH